MYLNNEGKKQKSSRETFLCYEKLQITGSGTTIF